VKIQANTVVFSLTANIPIIQVIPNSGRSMIVLFAADLVRRETVQILVNACSSKYHSTRGISYYYSTMLYIYLARCN